MTGFTRGHAAIITVISLIFVVSCSNPTLVDNSGTGQETTNGKICGFAITGSGAPAPRATVSLHRLEPVASDSGRIAVAITDSFGFYTFSAVAPGSYRILVEDTIDSLITLGEQILLRGGDSISRKDTMTTRATLRGSIAFSPPDSSSRFIGLVNTPFVAKCDSSGAFTFPSLPSGAYHIVSFYRVSRPTAKILVLALDSIDLSAGEDTTAGPLNRALFNNGDTHVILDDFEDGDKYRRDRGFWKRAGWGSSDETSIVYNHSPGVDSSRHCARIRFRMDSVSSTAHIGITSDLEMTYLDTLLVFAFDFTSLHTISFDIRGSAHALQVKLSSDAAGFWQSIFTIDTIPAQWTNITVDLSDAISHLKPWEQQQWERAKKVITKIAFQALRPDASMPANGEFQIDNIEMRFSQ